MKTQANQNDRLLRFLNAPPDIQARIDLILEGKSQPQEVSTAGPLLLTMGAAARLLGISRGTLWRMIRRRNIPKIELFPGSYRLRRCDIEGIAAVKNGGVS